MDLSNPAILSFIFLALAFSALFSGMEIAFVSASKLKIELDKKQGLLKGKLLSNLIQKPKIFIAAMLVGNNIALVAYGSLAGGIIVRLFEHISPNFYAELGTGLLLLIQTIISTIFVLIFAEFLPKSIFRINPNRWLNVFALPLTLLYYLLYPFAVFVTWLSKGFIRRIIQGETHNELVEFGTVDLNHFIKEGTDKSETAEDIDHEIQIFQNALDFSNVRARDCMIPRNEIIALDIEDDIETLRDIFVDTGLSKVLIYRDSIDHIIGYAHSYELFKKPAHIKEILLPLIIVPEPMSAHQIMKQFVQQKRNMAVVVDEFGGTSGIITMEDIIEEIFGEIEDEHDKEELIEKVIDHNKYLFSARHEIDHLNEKYKLSLPEDMAYDTLGGLIIHYHEDIPAKGASIETEDFIFLILEVSDTRIELVEVEVKD